MRDMADATVYDAFSKRLTRDASLAIRGIRKDDYCTTREIEAYLLSPLRMPTMKDSDTHAIASHPHIPAVWAVGFIHPTLGNPDLLVIHHLLARNCWLPPHLLVSLHHLYQGTNEIASDLVRNSGTPVKIVSDLASRIRPVDMEAATVFQNTDWALLQAYTETDKLADMDPSAQEYLIWSVSQLLDNPDEEKAEAAMRLLSRFTQMPDKHFRIPNDAISQMTRYVQRTNGIR